MDLGAAGARRRPLALAIAVLLACSACGGGQESGDGQEPGSPTRSETAAPGNASQGAASSSPGEPQTVVRNLEVPWALDFAPDGTLFFTERPGRVGIVPPGGDARRIATLPETFSRGEAGLLGLALHPDFERRPEVFVYQSYARGGEVRNRVLRFRWDAERRRLTDRRTLLDGIPGAVIHDGGRLRFGPGGLLYISTGDATDARAAQDPDALNGKILRITADGDVPPANPFGADNPVYTLGHRNPEGLAFHPNGELYATEHGPDGNDELNRIVAGENYGWPVVEGRGHGRFHAPVAVYPDTIAPAGLDVYTGPIGEWRGDLFWGTLGFSPAGGRHLHQADLAAPDALASQDQLYDDRFGRLRPVRMGPDGCLWFATSNRDGRGDPAPPDDRILRTCPQGG